MSLVEQVKSGERLALARLLSQLEDGEPAGQEALNQLYPHTGKAHLIGVTGAPGTGKSTLVNQLVLELRQGRGWTLLEGGPPRVAVLAVDPTSPFTGGAILGDRIRMRDLAGDPGVFIRSMASRGALGGLARTTGSLVQVLDAAGFDLIFIETVGAGQAEVQIASTAYTTVVVDAPGLGDEVQAIKAGILEIGDLIVVNKSDLPGAERSLKALRSSLELGHPARRRVRAPAQASPGDEENGEIWMPLVLPITATTGEGIPELLNALVHHRRYLVGSGELAERVRSRIRSEMEDRLRERLLRRALAARPSQSFEAMLERVLARELSPQTAIDAFLDGDGP